MSNKWYIDKNLKQYEQILAQIKFYAETGLKKSQFGSATAALKDRAANGEQTLILLPEAFALVFEAVKSALAMTPFDVQMIAAAAMANEHIIELPTGEGKTLVAVFVAYLYALSGKSVHVLTFNDYLAKRDALWMKPVYDLLGISVSFIQEGMSNTDRKEAYNADITYLTAKEAGFDYLRSFLAYDTDSIVQRPFHMAVIDEADSLMIDEARIPLVLAGDIPSGIEIDAGIYSAVSELKNDIHFQMDEYANNIYLTEAGAAQIESWLGLNNLNDAQNFDLLTKVNAVLQAAFLLKKDIDYIVRNDKVLLVDEFTGRVVKNRQWPDGLQAAVELKEGIVPKSQAIVMNRITLQSFFQFYPHLCGMTGTACSSASEFFEFYNKTITVIPPNKPCIRMDKQDLIFSHKQAKYDAVIQEIKTVHETGRPILIGTSSVEESERLAKLLEPYCREFFVLNAKNDAEEAEIISNAGKLNAITISTNMAGRGVDIRLGGKNAEAYEEICSRGGLYIIGINRFESERIDRQLRGRAGRQGDPGESRFFVSMEDDLFVKYRISESLPIQYQSLRQAAPLENPVIKRAFAHTQKIVEGQSLDVKITLAKYAAIAEDQRRIVYEKRKGILYGTDTLIVLEEASPERYMELLNLVGEAELKRAQRIIGLYAINQCWADHLFSMECALDEVQVISKVGKNPVQNYNTKMIDCFDHMEQSIRDMIVSIFDKAIIKDGHFDLDEMGVLGPSSTRTYLVNDGTELVGSMNNLAASAINPVLYLFYLLLSFFDKRAQRAKQAE